MPDPAADASCARQCRPNAPLSPRQVETLRRAPLTLYGNLGSRPDAAVIIIIAVGLSLRLAFSIANVLWLHIPYSNLDGFHATASLFADGEIPLAFRVGDIFSYLLGFAYRAFGSHVLVGYLLSALAWLVAAFALGALLDVLGAGRRAKLLGLAVFALLPSSLFFTTAIYREAYQLAFVTLAGLCAARVLVLRDYRWSVPWCWRALLRGFCMAA